MRINPKDLRASSFITILTCIQVLKASIEYNNDTNSKCPLMDTDADIILAGMFPVHVETAMENCLKNLCGYEVRKTPKGDAKCIRINKAGITWSEAMIYAIRDINRNNNILPGLKLGYIICDSYNSIPRALDISLTLQSLRHTPLQRALPLTAGGNTTNTCSCHKNATRTISGIVGGASSMISSVINYIMNVNDIPQISYSSTSPSLSDKFNFRTFFRTIPSDTYQGKALLDIILHFNWSYVSTVASSDDYGRLGVEALKEAARGRICFAYNGLFDSVLSLQKTKERIKKIISALKSDTKSKVIILFCEWPQAQAVLQEAERQNLTGKTWIASEAWGDNSFVYKIRSDVIGGMLGIIPSHGNIQEFKDYVRRINPRTYAGNLWFNEYLQSTTRCLKPLDYTFNKCANVMDAVYALAYAIHEVLKCRRMSTCMRSDVSSINSSETVLKLGNLTFTGALGTMTFDKNGDPSGSYVITNLQPQKNDKSKMKFTYIGKWNGNSRKFHLNKNTSILWNCWKTETTTSICSLPCKPGYFGIAGKNKCCWSCFKCQADHIKPSFGQDKCKKCAERQIPNSEHTRCIDLDERYLGWSNYKAIILLVVSFSCACLTVVTLTQFIRLRKTPIVKASNCELSYLLLCTLTLIFLCPLAFIGLPSHQICVLRPAGTGILLTIATSILSVRAYRYLTIFQSKMMQKARALQGLTAQFSSVFACTLPPIATVAIGYALYIPDSSKRIVFGHSDKELPKVFRECNLASQYLGIILSAYVVLLSIICCTLAFRTRKLPEVFNDARWLAMTMFTNNIIWFASLTVYLVRRNERPLIMPISVVLSGFVIWAFNFLPKLIVILMHPERNRKEVISRQIFKATCKRVDKKVLSRSRSRGVRNYLSAASEIAEKDEETYMGDVGGERNVSTLTDLNSSNGQDGGVIQIIDYN